MLMHATAHGGCTDTIRESAPEADSGRKIPLPPQGLKPAFVLKIKPGFFSWMFYQTTLSRPLILASSFFFFSFLKLKGNVLSLPAPYSSDCLHQNVRANTIRGVNSSMSGLLSAVVIVRLTT